MPSASEYGRAVTAFRAACAPVCPYSGL